MEHFHSRGQQLCKFLGKKVFTREKFSIPTGVSWYTNSATVSLFWYTNMVYSVTRHQYGISALVTQTSFFEGSSGDLAKCRLFSRAKGNVSFLKYTK